MYYSENVTVNYAACAVITHAGKLLSSDFNAADEASPDELDCYMKHIAKNEVTDPPFVSGMHTGG